MVGVFSIEKTPVLHALAAQAKRGELIERAETIVRID
jgi:hypothetical protein